MESDDGPDSGYHPGREPASEDARVVVDFAVGPGGVGPAVGFGSDDFFPVVPDAGRPDGPASGHGTRRGDTE